MASHILGFSHTYKIWKPSMSFYQDNLDFLKGDLEEVYMDNLLNFRTNTLKEKHVKLRKISI